MTVGDGAYVVATGDQINLSYAQIEPGVYRCGGEAVFGASYQIFGPWGNLLYQGFGATSETTISIPRLCYVFQTTGMEPWTKIGSPPTLWLRMPDASWLNVSDPQTDTPADLLSGFYNPWQLRLRALSPGWFYQANDRFPLYILMPDGYWLAVGHYGGHPDLGSPDPGFMIPILPYGLDSTEAATSLPVWNVRSLNGTPTLSQGSSVPLNVFYEIDGSGTHDTRLEYYSVDLDLVRWADRALNPDNTFYLSLRFASGVDCFTVVAGDQVAGLWGEVVLHAVTGTVVDTATFPNVDGFHVTGQYVPRISLTGEPVAGTPINTFTASPDTQYFDVPISLPALDGLHTLDFALIPTAPATPDPGDSARVNGGVSIYLAFSP